jgi:hypothetical protein
VTVRRARGGGASAPQLAAHAGLKARLHNGQHK